MPNELDQDGRRRLAGVSYTTIARHALLFVITFITTTIAGALFPFGPVYAFPDFQPQSLQDFLLALINLPGNYALLVFNIIRVIMARPEYLYYGLSFSTSLLFILLSHEMGHYIACRIYRVRSTLPFFIPTPPLVGPAGTFGAFIRIKSPFPSRRAIFDIGVAGPIAGFIALIPVAIIGLVQMETLPPERAAEVAEGTISFADPLLLKILAAVIGKDISLGIGNPFYFAAWLGLLVTALNLIPSGQLDGGHAIYAVFGERVHIWSGRIGFVAMAAASAVGLVFYGSPSGILFTIILAVMMKMHHPRPYDNRPPGAGRIAVAVITAVIFILSFVPVPIRFNY
jgi:membrane-associated protease RseP (regulator of RpoE activity)